jgi:hypothetical protein
MWSIHTCHPALERKEMLTHAAAWRNLEDIIWSKLSPPQKDKHLYASIYMSYLEKQVHRDRK